MVQMTDRALGVLKDLPPLPSYVTPQEVIADALPLLDPPSRMTVTDAAEHYMRVSVAGVWQNYDRNVAPYTVEPADITQSRRYKTVCFTGSSQSGKSKMLETVAMHTVMCAPSPVQVIHMSQTDRNAWVEEKLDQTINNSPLIRDRLGRAREDSTFNRKRFRGMGLSIGYPVASQLSSRTQRMVLLTDYDHMPQRLGPADSPEGTPYGMARDRIRTYMTRGCVLVESTPSFPVTDATWQQRKSAPHEMPPVSGGIVQIYNEGTRGRWYWECLDCHELFEPRFGLLNYDDTQDPQTAGDGAKMMCPHCGSLTDHRHKVELNRRTLKGHGGWLHEAGDGSLVTINDPAIRGTDIASYAMNGTAAAFVSWSELVAAYMNAVAKFESLGDEMDLAKFHYTGLGVPHRPRRESGDALNELNAIKEKRQPVERGVAPDWVRFVTVTADVQGSYFPVLVTGWGLDGRRVVIDRFDLAQPPEHAPRASDRGLDPAQYIDDWDVLIDLESRVYPVIGSPFGLKPVALVVDFQGKPGVSDNAERFWRSRRAAGAGSLWFLSRGYGGLNQRDRVWFEAPERASQGRKARGIKLLNMATDRLKDTVTAALERTSDLPGAYVIPEGDWFTEDHLVEFTAEQRTERGWNPRKGMVRNESLDLSVQAQAVAEHKGLRRINPEAPPSWAVLGDANPHAVRTDIAVPEVKATDVQKTNKPAAQPTGDWIQPRSDWI
jgi:phage terminase large subunit GpA-like protein